MLFRRRYLPRLNYVCDAGYLFLNPLCSGYHVLFCIVPLETTLAFSSPLIPCKDVYLCLTKYRVRGFPSSRGLSWQDKNRRRRETGSAAHRRVRLWSRRPEFVVETMDNIIHVETYWFSKPVRLKCNAHALLRMYAGHF